RVPAPPARPADGDTAPARAAGTPPQRPAAPLPPGSAPPPARAPHPRSATGSSAPVRSRLLRLPAERGQPRDIAAQLTRDPMHVRRASRVRQVPLDGIAAIVRQVDDRDAEALHSRALPCQQIHRVVTIIDDEIGIEPVLDPRLALRELAHCSFLLRGR